MTFLNKGKEEVEASQTQGRGLLFFILSLRDGTLASPTNRDCFR